MIAYTLIRSDRRSISLIVKRDGTLVVRAPLRMSLERIEAFLREKEKWAREKQQEAARQAAYWQPLTGAAGERLPYHGKWLTLTQADVERITPAEDRLLLPPGSGPEELRQWARELALELLTEAVIRQGERMGLACQPPKLSEARGRWGSCSAKDVLRFSWRLALCPPEVMEYVVVHELCHIKHKNHGHAFWAAVEADCPDWKRWRDWLRENRRIMDLL